MMACGPAHEDTYNEVVKEERGRTGGRMYATARRCMRKRVHAHVRRILCRTSSPSFSRVRKFTYTNQYMHACSLW